MPRFYFDVWEDGRFIEDRDGVEFPDLDAAEHEASETAAEISHDLLPKGTGHLVTVELRNEHRQRIATATATLTLSLDRVHPEPAPPPRLVK